MTIFRSYNNAIVYRVHLYITVVVYEHDAWADWKFLTKLSQFTFQKLALLDWLIRLDDVC